MLVTDFLGSESSTSTISYLQCTTRVKLGSKVACAAGRFVSPLDNSPATDSHPQQLEKENAVLRKTIRTLLAQDEDDSTNEEDASDDSDEAEKYVPVWDKEDLTFRCTECAWEVVDGLCHSCGLEFLWDEVSLKHNPRELFRDPLTVGTRGAGAAFDLDTFRRST